MVVIKSKKAMINHIYQTNKLFRFVAGKGKQLLGIQIQKLQPQNIDEWRTWVMDNQEIPQNLALTLQRNSMSTKFNKYKEALELITYSDYLDWAIKLVVNDYWKGYSNELVAQQYFIDKGFEVFNTDYKDDVRHSIDFHIIKEKEGIRLVGAVSVKSQGFLFSNTKQQIISLHKKLTKLKIEKHYHKVLLVIVDDDKQVKIQKSY